MSWVAYVVVWLTFALLWALAGASSSGESPVHALPYGLLAMGSAGLMGLAIWRMTDRVPLDWRVPTFYVAHGIGLMVFCSVYATSWIWIDVAAGRADTALAEVGHSRVLLWNLLMGTWLYIMVAGVSYAVRAQQSLRAQAAAAAEARLLAEQAQLAALRAQINPHFLFNALHSVGALVTTDPARADQALERLGDLLRYALGAAEEVPLRDEWQFSRDYLAFEHLRYGDRLTADERLDDAALAVLVPPLILQPLVENAVRHGVADRPGGGRVVLGAAVQNGDLVLSVSDDGRGRRSPPGNGIGMDSVRRRLSALHGRAASLHVADGSEGYSVVIRLPARREADAERDPRRHPSKSRASSSTMSRSRGRGCVSWSGASPGSRASAKWRRGRRPSPPSTSFSRTWCSST